MVIADTNTNLLSAEKQIPPFLDTLVRDYHLVWIELKVEAWNVKHGDNEIKDNVRKQVKTFKNIDRDKLS